MVTLGGAEYVFSLHGRTSAKILDFDPNVHISGRCLGRFKLTVDSVRSLSFGLDVHPRKTFVWDGPQSLALSPPSPVRVSLFSEEHLQFVFPKILFSQFEKTLWVDFFAGISARYV